MENQIKKLTRFEENQIKGGAEMRDRIGVDGVGIFIANYIAGGIGLTSELLLRFYV